MPFMETDSSFTCSQEPATRPYPKPGKSSPYSQTPFYNPFQHYPPIYAYVFKVVYSLQIIRLLSCVHLSSPPWVLLPMGTRSSFPGGKAAGT
jgi:hypothetical protein